MKIKNELERQREIEEMEKDFCLECGVEVFDGGSWGYCVPCGNEVFDKLIQNIGQGLMNEQDNFRESYNVHDPHNEHVWADNKPWWLTPLQVLGFVATGVGLTVCLYYATLILFLL